VSGTNPATSLGTVATFAALVGFSSATQDIAMDAWRIEVAGVSRQGAMAAAYQWGYRVAVIVAGAVPLVFAQAYGWNLSYALMAALMMIGVIAVMAAPREERHDIRPIHAEAVDPAPAREALEWVTRLAVLAAGALLVGSGLTANARALGVVLNAVRATGLRETILSVWSSPAGLWFQLLAVALGFSAIVLSALPFLAPFYLDLGFTLVEAAEVRKIFGVVMTSVLFALFVAIGIENVTNGFAATCLIAYMSS
jgi:MFS transporter, PAT family, beta-lactamase induction signal transducer AmpG